MLEASAEAIRACVAITDDIAAAARRIGDALEGGHKVLICGNGGSAADAQHFAGELLGRFRSSTRPPLAGLALSADAAVITCIANDFDYDDVFARQVRALAQPGDVLIGISTSAKSENVLRAFAASPDGTLRIALVGPGGALADRADIALRVRADATAHIQAGHIAVLHAICEALERRFDRSLD
ncbi:MAG: SIS domain-containing protein [Chloroflexi bacterium]|nr:MAG: SIS domain-containing protein [Chloroflexota bacterium]